jgi:hypothetical protein
MDIRVVEIQSRNKRRGGKRIQVPLLEIQVPLLETKFNIYAM